MQTIMSGNPRRLLWTVSIVSLLAAACSTPTTPDVPTAPVVESMGNSTSTPMPTMPTMPAAPETARYRVTFEASWSVATHPVDLPGSAHFSRLVGGNHNESVVFWREGDLASQGIREMAEFGRTNPLDREITAAIGAGSAEILSIGPPVDKSPATVTMDIVVSQRFPLYTLVSMIAPSPDWFVGVAGLRLFENGQWIAERRVDLDPWDAGTDSGLSFFSPDQVTTPLAPITRIVTAPLSPNGRVTPLGRFVFTRIE